MTITPTAYEAFLKVKGLRELAYDNSMSTHRSQNAVLQALSVEDLASVAMLLESGTTTDSARLLIEAKTAVPVVGGKQMKTSTLLSTF